MGDLAHSATLLGFALSKKSEVDRMAELPLSSVGRVMKRAGAYRVSTGGKESLRDVLEEYASKVASKAVTLAEHAGRKTVRAEDITLATS